MTCVGFIKQLSLGDNAEKAVYEVLWNGVLVIAKMVCCSCPLYQIYGNKRLTTAYNYASEVGVYEKLHDLKPEGYGFFPSMLAYGRIICSSKFPSGYIAILSKVNGEPLYCYLNPPSEPFAEEKPTLPIEDQPHIYT